jgi:hypothetical protein
MNGGLPSCFPLKKLLLSLVSAHCVFAAGLGALDAADGRMRLSLHENSGRFSLYYLAEGSTGYAPLFTAQDPRTSFLAINLNDRIYRLGEAAAFKTGIDREGPVPALVFESPFLLVREEFAFIKTAGASESNGLKITLWIKNLSSREIHAGLRFLLDTSLGEGPGRIPFFVDDQVVTSETAVEYGGGFDHWVSRNDGVSLMGSIPNTAENGDALPGGFLHFSNWKRLNDVPWKADYIQGRSFNNPPYSIGDSAVCYYFEPLGIQSGESIRHTVILSVFDPAGFGAGGKDSEREADMAMLRNLIARLDRYIAGEITMNAEELAAIEQTILKLKTRYNLR